MPASKKRRQQRATKASAAVSKKKGRKKPGRAKKRKAIASATSLRAAINRLKAENARLKSAKPKRRKCACKKKSVSAVAHTHHKPKKATRRCAPVHGKKRTTSLYKRARKTVKKFAGF